VNQKAEMTASTVGIEKEGYKFFLNLRENVAF